MLRSVRPLGRVHGFLSRGSMSSISRLRHLYKTVSSSAPHSVYRSFSTASHLHVSPNTKRGRERDPLDLKVGDEMHGFKVTDVTYSQDFQCTVYSLLHLKTRAQYVHVDTHDTNNVFAVSFRTPPKDSTGVAHILEHTVLCGSEKYPVRDPFFNMLKRSLNTFMNAFTGSDYTMYPFSTQNAQDYRNLMSVYLDAAFFPRLRESDFKQEGHRLEFEVPNDSTSPLMFKGVVFNEMKGAMSDAGSRYAQGITSELYQNTTYHYNSGGEPADIPNLTYDGLRAFHRVHYHPSNARFYSYGDLSLAEHLEMIQTHVLKRFTPIDPKTEVNNADRWRETKTAVQLYPKEAVVTDEKKQTKFGLAFLCDDAHKDPFKTFAMQILSSLLLDGPASPMYKALIDTRIGSGYAPVVGYDAHTKEASFAFGCNNIAEEDVVKVEKIILDTLEEVVKKGFESERIEAIIHQIELSQKEVTTTFGLSLAQRMLPSWLHNGDVLIPLKINSLIDRLRSELAKGPYFENLIRSELLSNQHRVRFVMKPDETILEREGEEERKKLNQITSELSQQDKDKIVSDALELLRIQENKEDVSILPTLTVADIQKTVEHVSDTKKQLSNGIDLHLFDQPTNGLVYVRLKSDIRDMPIELRRYVPLFSSFFAKMGTTKRSYADLSQSLDLHTGGIGLSSLSHSNYADTQLLHQSAVLQTSFLQRKADPAFELMTELLCGEGEQYFDLKRLDNLIDLTAANISTALTDSGHQYAIAYAASGLYPLGHLSELLGGVSHVKLISDLAKLDDKSKLRVVSEKFRDILKFILNKNRLKIAVSGEPQNFDQIQQQLEKMLQTVPISNDASVATGAHAVSFSPSIRKHIFKLPMQVNFGAQCVPTVPYTHTDAPVLTVLARIMSSCFLHREIREKGGAYGGGASNSTNGVFTFYSYRDPQTTKTLDVFAQASEWAANGQFHDQDIDEALLYIFGDLDSPTPPSSKGMSRFLRDLTTEQRQEFRDKLFNVKRPALCEVAHKYLVSPQQAGRASSVIFAAEENVDEGFAKDGWTIKTPTDADL
eukprot:GILK01009947.1.p1 GENE.GILK01009947.1~~GILK01009947.1.p1  ORF type:complete len:1054 (+),score=218.44 GILK01009947.1:44-3205(+)